MSEKGMSEERLAQIRGYRITGTSRSPGHCSCCAARGGIVMECLDEIDRLRARVAEQPCYCCRVNGCLDGCGCKEETEP